MSFGFGVGDFIAVGELCWKIYTRVYKVSRDAPEELRALIQELGNLSNTVNLLNEEVRDKEEWIKRAGVRRLEYTCKVMSQARETLGKMDRLADKYAELDPGANSQGSKRSLRIQWNRIKYALEVSSINELRSKFMSHNFHLTLLLQGAQNSSLERIEKQQTKTDIKLEELRNAMIGDRSSRKSPLLKAPLDEEVRAELSAAFLRSAETGNRPWASIGIDDWLQAGKWWLLKARSQINHLAQGSGVEVQAYVNLLKACWILTDIVSIHPQRTHLGASNDRRNDDIRNLSQIAKTTLENFPVFDFQLHDVEDYTMNIWLQASPLSTIAPRRQLHINRDSPNWQTSEGEVLFQCFAEICSTTEETENAPEECYFILEVPQQGFFLNAILQNFAGQDIFKLKVEPREHRVDFISPRSDAWQELQGRVEKLGSSFRVLNLDALLAFLWGFQLFASAFQPASLSVSTVHSVSVLANWRSQDRSCLLLPGYDTGCPTQSDSLALLLRTIISDLNEKGNKDMSPTSKLLAIDCMNDKYSLGALAWKLICWRCEKFSDIKSLLEEFHVGEHLRDDLLQTAFLRLDHDFLSQLVQYMNYEDGWNPPDILIMVEAALTSDDVRHLLWMLERVAASVLSENQTAISQRVYSSRRLEHIDAMMQVIVPRPADIAAALAWYLGSSDEQSFKHFLHTFQCLGRSFHRKTADEVDFSDFYPLFVDGCGHLIESQCSNTLSLYLDSLEGLGIDFHFIEGRKNTESSQLAVIPALVSPDPSFLRILLERQVIAPDMQPFIVEYRPPISLKYPDSPALIQYPPPSMPHWPLYCALMLVCDVEYLQLLCQNGASLQQESKDFQDHQNKAQGILDHLSRLSSLEEARLEHMEALMFCHILIHVGIKGWHFCSNSPDLFKATGNTLDTTDYRKTWRRMERLLYHDSFFLSCSYPCDRARKGSWKSQPGVRSELISRYAKFPGHYPKHLRTQTSWDAWRRDALQILMKQTHEALIVRSETR